MNSRFKSYDLVRVARSAAARWKAPLTEGCQEWRLELPSEAGKGTLAVFDFEDGHQMLLLDGRLKESWQWNFHAGEPSPFLLFFTGSGKISLALDGRELDLGALHALLALHPPGSRQAVWLRGGEDLVFLLLCIKRELYTPHAGCFSEQVSQEVSAIFSGSNSLKHFSNSEFGTQSAVLVRQMLADDQRGLPRAAFIEAKAMELFALRLRHWEQELKGGSGKKSALRPDDVLKITRARNLLVSDLQNAPTIEELAKLAGVNRQKLKAAFKQVYQKTINAYLRDERLKTARDLLAATGQPVVRDVAATVGYDNPSYFARRFKEKYGAYPGDFAKAVRVPSWSGMGEESPGFSESGR